MPDKTLGSGKVSINPIPALEFVARGISAVNVAFILLERPFMKLASYRGNIQSGNKILHCLAIALSLKIIDNQIIQYRSSIF